MPSSVGTGAPAGPTGAVPPLASDTGAWMMGHKLAVDGGSRVW